MKFDFFVMSIYGMVCIGYRCGYCSIYIEDMHNPRVYYTQHEALLIYPTLYLFDVFVKCHDIKWWTLSHARVDFSKVITYIGQDSCIHPDYAIYLTHVNIFVHKLTDVFIKQLAYGYESEEFVNFSRRRHLISKHNYM